MQHKSLVVENVKCGGCVAAISNGLQQLEGIEHVEVRIDGGIVDIEGSAIDDGQVFAKLAELGYPARSQEGRS